MRVILLAGVDLSPQGDLVPGETTVPPGVHTLMSAAVMVPDRARLAGGGGGGVVEPQNSSVRSSPPTKLE